MFVRVVEGMNVVEAIENTKTGAQDRPILPVVISDCGELEENNHNEVADAKEEASTSEPAVESETTSS